MLTFVCGQQGGGIFIGSSATVTIYTPLFFNNIPGDIFNSASIVRTMTSCDAGSSTLFGRPIDIEGTFVTSGFLFNQIGCELCTAGKFISDPQELACSDCEKGKSNINIGSSSADDCVSCSVGTYENEEGSSRPEFYFVLRERR